MTTAANSQQPTANRKLPPRPSRFSFASFASRLLLLLLLLLFFSTAARAHVGSKDVFEQVFAGPYKLFVTVRMPNVIPGIATIEVRTSGASVDTIRITPMPLTGEASKHPPTPDTMKRSDIDPNFYTGSLWIMARGSWQVRFEVTGASGIATASVPVAAAPLAVLRMQRPLGALLAVLGLILAFGFAGIIGAAVRESRLEPGVEPAPARRRRALHAMGGTIVFLVVAIVAANHWWNVEAADYGSKIYQPLAMHPMLSGNVLSLTIDDDIPAENPQHKLLELNDLLLDHGKIMHLYAIREPDMDAVFHLHPELVSKRALQLTLPAMPPGTYKLYADIVFRTGFPETLTSTLTIPSNASTAPLAADDASAFPAPLSQSELGSSYKLPDGYTMTWDRPAHLTANTATTFRFTLSDSTGKPASDVHPYLGMAGHAAFVKTDGTVFAHTHPDGSAAMPALMLANGETPPHGHIGGDTSSADNMPDMPGMSGMSTSAATLPPAVEFPYGFPSPGRYRIFIQMKHGATVETGVFDADVQ
jgi:hypothetical protein